MLPEQLSLDVSNVFKSFGPRRVLTGVEFRVARGELLGIIGENGAGKTTLLRILAGEVAPDLGEVVRHGVVGYCPQRIVLNNELTVEQHLQVFQRAYQVPRLGRAYELLDRLTYGQYLKTKVGLLSGGTRQKLNLTLALMHGPDVVLMDEPYQGLDWENYLNFWSIVDELRATGCSVLVISHIAHDTERFDRLLHLRAGRMMPSEPPRPVAAAQERPLSKAGVESGWGATP